MAQILVIDDEAAFRDGLIETLIDLGQEAVGVGTTGEALDLIEKRKFKAIFIDFKMPDVDGLTAIKLIREKLGKTIVPIVMVTAYINSSNTIEAMRLGAFDHLTKPIGRKDVDLVVSAINKAFPESKDKQNSMTRKPPEETGSIIGTSPAIREVLKMIGRLAASDSSVLITGETGTGKELIARAIHQNSDRAKGPFIAVNCAAIPEALLESELFGHLKGAFTGAANDRKGSFPLADGGTLLLDEIGDMDLALQGKLLRALQEREITPVGSSKPIKINVRFLAATHRDLKVKIQDNKFREDLYYRLNVIELHLPSLRDRKEDIRTLADFFLGKATETDSTKSFSQASLEKLDAYSWPGNIRELKNVVDRAFIVAKGQLIDGDDIRFLTQTESTVKTESESLDLHLAVAQLERKLIVRALAETEGNRSEAARKLGIQRQLLYSKMRDYQI